jgi:hypothetical protein
LTLSGNEIRIEGGLSIVDSLENHVETLKKLNLDGNFFGDAGVEEITSRVNSAGIPEGVLVEFEYVRRPETCTQRLIKKMRMSVITDRLLLFVRESPEPETDDEEEESRVETKEEGSEEEADVVNVNGGAPVVCCDH